MQRWTVGLIRMSGGGVYIKRGIVPSLKQDTVCTGRKAVRHS